MRGQCLSATPPSRRAASPEEVAVTLLQSPRPRSKHSTGALLLGPSGNKVGSTCLPPPVQHVGHADRGWGWGWGGVGTEPHTRRGVAGLCGRPCAARVRNPALSGSTAEWTGAAPMDYTVPQVSGRRRGGGGPWRQVFNQPAQSWAGGGGKGAGMDLIGGVGVPPSPPPVVTRRHDTRHKKTRSQIEPRRVPGGKQDNPSREAFNANHCIRQQTVFFSFLGSPPGFLFTVTVQQGSYSLSLSLSVPLSSSLTVRALELEASVEMLPKEDRELPESETCPRLSTYSAVSGRTRSFSFVLSRLPHILRRAPPPMRCGTP